MKFTALCSFCFLASFSLGDVRKSDASQISFPTEKRHSVAENSDELPDLRQSRQYQDALKYAPILWFADNEKYFPTIPFFSAFDGEDNDGDSKVDFEDPDEIAPIWTVQRFGRSRINASWKELNSWYENLREKKKELAVVFYKVEALKARALRAIIWGDEQVWPRLDKEFRAYLESKSTSFHVYLYYFYYINDAGIRGHPEDIEHVAVFVPSDSSKQFRIIAAAGHGRDVPNNVLIYDEGSIPKDYLSHPHILVELGSHSSAPDIKADGKFDPGVDANWHTENVWGTRDIQATTGRGGVGPYESWMTFERSTSDPNKLFPPDPGCKSSNQYKLLPVSKMRRIDSLLTVFKSPTLQSGEKIGSSALLDGLVSELNFLKSLGFKVNTEEVDEQDLIRMTFWTDHLNKADDSTEYDEQSKEKHKIWEHDDFKERDVRYIFKNHLYRSRKLINPGFWVQFEPQNRTEFRFAFTVPAWAATPVKLDGVIEIHAGVTGRASSIYHLVNEPKPVVSIYYDRFYSSLFSFYVNSSWIPDRPNSSDFTLGGGVSILPKILLSTGHNAFFRWLRLRAGLRVGLKTDTFIEPDPIRFEVQLGVHY